MTAHTPRSIQLLPVAVEQQDTSTWCCAASEPGVRTRGCADLKDSDDDPAGSVLHGESITDQASPRTPTQRTFQKANAQKANYSYKRSHPTPLEADAHTLGLCSVCQVNLICVQGCCAGGCFATLLVAHLCGGIQCLIREWCRLTVVWVDCGCSLLCCVSALRIPWWFQASEAFSV